MDAFLNPCVRSDGERLDPSLSPAPSLLAEDGRGVLYALGADGVWCGSRFLVTPEANAADDYKQALLNATSDQTFRTEIYTGRPLRVIKNSYF